MRISPLILSVIFLPIFQGFSQFCVGCAFFRKNGKYPFLSLLYQYTVLTLFRFIGARYSLLYLMPWTERAYPRSLDQRFHSHMARCAKPPPSYLRKYHYFFCRSLLRMVVIIPLISYILSLRNVSPLSRSRR